MMDKTNKHLQDRVLVYAIIWVLSYVMSLYILKTFTISFAVGIVLTIVPILAFVLLMYKYQRSVLLLDELAIKIKMEAITWAFSLGLLLLMGLGLIELFYPLNKEDWSFRHLVPCFFVFYFIGHSIASRKYYFEDEKYD